MRTPSVATMDGSNLSNIATCAPTLLCHFVTATLKRTLTNSSSERATERWQAGARDEETPSQSKTTP